jgi:hypothetical protein
MPANIFVTGSGISWHRTLRRNHFTSCANGISGLNSMRTKILKIVVKQVVISYATNAASEFI